MYTFSSRLFRSLFPRLAEYMARRRAALETQLTARRQHGRYVRLRLEVLENRLVPTVYTFTGAVNDNWSVPGNWATQNGQGGVPGAPDEAEIPGNLTCIVDQPEKAFLVDVEPYGNLIVNQSLTVDYNGGAPGGFGIDDGTATLSAPVIVDGNGVGVTNGGVLNVGSPNDPSADATLTTNKLELDPGAQPGTAVNVGLPNGGSSGTIDTQTLTCTGGALNIGTGGATGTVNVSRTMSDTGAISIGSSSGGSGTLGVYTLTASSVQIYATGALDVQHDASIHSAVTSNITGGVIDASADATVTLGNAVVTNGPVTGNLTGGTWTLLSNVSLNTGATLGPDDFYIDGTVDFNEGYLDDAAKLILQNNGTTLGNIDGTGEIILTTEFDWEGGTIGGLTGGGFSIGNLATQQPGTFLASGSDGKTLSTILTNTALSNTVKFDGTGNMAIQSSGEMINEAPSSLPMEISLPSFGGVGLFENEGYVTLGGSSTEIPGLIDNTPAAVIDGSGALTLSYNRTSSNLSGTIDIGGPITMSGLYNADNLTMSSGGGMTLTGTLTNAGNTVLTNVILNGGTINGSGQLYTEGYFNWINGTITGIAMTVDPTSTLTLSNNGTMGSNLYLQGTMEWEQPVFTGFTFNSGTEIDIEKGGLFDFEGNYGNIPTLINDGTLILGSNGPLMVGTFEQGSDGTLQENIGANSSGMLSVTGSATLGGTLDVNLQNGYQPPSGTSFDVMNYGSYSGQFANINPQGWVAQYNSNSLDLVSP